MAVADLLDLETEVQQIEQGLQQLEQIPTGTDAFGATPFADPFQDSFVGNVCFLCIFFFRKTCLLPSDRIIHPCYFEAGDSSRTAIYKPSSGFIDERIERK